MSGNAVNPQVQLPAVPAQPPAPPAPMQLPAAPGAAGAAQAVAAPARHPRAPRPVVAGSSATVTSLPSMLMLVSNQGFATVNRHTLNTFVPSFLVAAAIIQDMNHVIGNTHRFMQSAPDWSPYLTLAFYGNCFIIQALRAYREVQPLPMHEEWLLSGIESVIGLDALMIPGPLVPVFQALAASSAPFEWLGNVAPSVLNITRDCNQNTDYILHDVLNFTFPGVLVYLDMIHRFRNVALTADQATRQLILARFYRSIFQVDVTDSQTDRILMMAPGMPARPYHSTEFLTQVQGLLNLDLPARLDRNGNDANDLNLAQFMGLYDAPTIANGTYHNWFTQAAGIHARYAGFFRESVPLSAITPSGIGASLVTSIYAAGQNNGLANRRTFHAAVAAAAGVQAQRAYYDLREISTLAIVCEHGDQALEEIAEQAASLAAVNVDVVTNLGLTNPTNAILRTGDVWALPVVRRSGTINIAQGIYARIVASYHTDTRN